MTRGYGLALSIALAVGVSGGAQAALIDRGGGLIYDNVLDITWLQDANYAQTSEYDTDGLMSWVEAMTWVANLSYLDSVSGLTLTGWRLPTALNQDGTGRCYGNNCTGSELGHMHYNNMGASAHSSILNGTNTANLDLFKNIRSSVYWSGTEYGAFPIYAGVFHTVSGFQDNIYKGLDVYAWVVRPGDVADNRVGAVPLPGALWLLLPAVVGLPGRKRPAQAVCPLRS